MYLAKRTSPIYDAIICAQKFARDPSELSATKGTLPAGLLIVSKLHYQTKANSDEFCDLLKCANYRDYPDSTIFAYPGNCTIEKPH